MRSFQRAVTGVCILLGTLTPVFAQSVEDDWKKLMLQGVYEATAKHYSTSEEILQKALHEAERFGAADPRVGTTLNSLGLIYREDKKIKEAQAVFERALPILDSSYGSDSIDVANVNYNIASTMVDQGLNASAIPYLNKSLSVYEDALGASSIKTAAVLCMLGDAYRLTKDFQLSEGPLNRCADIRESDGGVQNADFGAALHSLALTLQGLGKYAQADPRFKLAEKIQESTLGITSPELAQTFEDHAVLLQQLGRDKEAARLRTLAAAIRHSEKK